MMDEPYLYRKIAAAIRQEIASGSLKPGDRLPTVRKMAARWNCTIGTVQRAYQELARQGLVTSRSGQGTHVVENPQLQGRSAFRRAELVHRAEAFLLEVLTAGYSLVEVDESMRQAMDRWRSVEQEAAAPVEEVLRFAGSHDLVVTWLASHFPEIAPGYTLQLRFTGSLGGLMALASHQAELAGSHLWDEESDTYNLPFVRRVLPGQRIALVTLAYRRLGLILPAGNPAGILGLGDLTRPGLRFVNRQPGSGTRVWLDAALRREGIDGKKIQGYSDEKVTHSAVAQAVAEGQADVGFGLEGAARGYGLDFILLARDRYDFVIPAAIFESAPVHRLVGWLQSQAARSAIEGLGSYDTHETGQVNWSG